MSISQDSNGFTVVTLEAGDRAIYVANAGSDSNSGLSSGSPKQTLAAGVALIRSGHGDQLLLNRGDTFTGSMVLSNPGGVSSSNPWVIGTYGTGARPIVKPTANNHGVAMEGGAYSNIFILGINFYCEHRDPGAGTPDITSTSVGVRYGNAYGATLWVEDCEMSYFINGISIEGRDASNYLNGVTLRRNIVHNNYRNATAHGQGCYINTCKAILLLENVFDANGSISYSSDTTPDQFSHNVYINTENITNAHDAVGNFFLRASSHGLQFRRGGTVTDNVASDNPIGILFGGGNTPVPGGVAFASARNVVLNGTDIDSSNRRGTGFDFSNINSGTSVDDVAAHDTTLSAHPNAVGFNIGATATGISFLRRITWDWTNPYNVDAGGSATDTQGYSGALGGPNTPGYTSPARTLATYNGSLGGTATLAAFATALRGRSILSWDSRYSAAVASQYIRDGFATSGASGGQVGGGGAGSLLTLL